MVCPCFRHRLEIVKVPVVTAVNDPTGPTSPLGLGLLAPIE